MTLGTGKKIVTSIYDLNYITERGGGLYKGFHVLAKTIENIIFDEYEYVIYTDKKTLENHNLNELFNKPNITIKINELNNQFFSDVIKPLQLKKISEGCIWDRIHCVDNYVEVMYNKLDYLMRESENFDGSVVWIDAGLFGTSCGVGWRDYMCEIAHSKKFLDGIFTNIQNFGFISLKGNHIIFNYQEKAWIDSMFGVSSFIIPGGLFGGNSKLVLNYFKDYQNIIKRMVNEHGFYTSDQEVLCVLISKQEQIKYFEFDDWNDLQKGILKIMDLYDESKYSTESCSLYREKNNIFE
jgi:hypothetical protein